MADNANTGSDASVRVDETWYVVIAATEEGLRYLAEDNKTVTDPRRAERHPSYGTAKIAAADAIESMGCPAMAKRLTVSYSVDNVRDGEYRRDPKDRTAMPERYADILRRIVSETGAITAAEAEALYAAWPSFQFSKRSKLFACMWDVECAGRASKAPLAQAIKANPGAAASIQILKKAAREAVRC